MGGPVRKEPGPDHPITVEPGDARVVVRLDGSVVADTKRALVLREAGFPPVPYIPRDDADLEALTRTATTTYCPYKGTATYYASAGGSGDDVVWTYEDPYPAAAAIQGYLAFHPDRVDSIEELAGDG